MLLEHLERIIATLRIHAAEPRLFQNGARIHSYDHVIIDGEGVGNC